MGDQSIARPMPTQDNINAEDKQTYFHVELGFQNLDPTVRNVEKVHALESRVSDRSIIIAFVLHPKRPRISRRSVLSSE
jgi:hypothetical protein